MSQHAGAMIALVPSAEDAERLAVAGGEPATELHCTIAYLGKADQFDTAARQQLIAASTAAVQGMPVVDAEAFGVASFGQGSDEPCTVLNVGGSMLDAAHHFLTEFIPFEAPDQHAPWHAHVTLEFTDDLGKLRQMVNRLGPIRFDRVRLAIGGDVIDIPLLPDNGVAEDDGFAEWLADEGLAEADVHPGDGRLKRFWLGKGLSKWADSPHPWTALYRHLRKYITNTVLLKKTVSRWYIDHFGHTPNQHGKVVEAATAGLVEVAIVESGSITSLHPDDLLDAEPLGDDEQILLAALDELDAELVEVFDASQARYPKGHPKGGQWRPMIDRIKDSIMAGRRGEHGDRHPLDGYSREQLRKVAVARGIDLKRGEDRDSIAAKLLDHLGGTRHGQTAPEPFDTRIEAAATADDALDAPEWGFTRADRPAEFTRDMSMAVFDYSGWKYQGVNRHLRGQTLPYGTTADDVKPIVAGIDAAMARSALQRDSALFRGVVNAEPMFGDRLDGDLSGMEWRELAYTSTSANPRAAAMFTASSQSKSVLMRILAPKGTPALQVSGWELEAEVLIARGERFRVVHDYGVEPNGVRHIDVEVVS